MYEMLCHICHKFLLSIELILSCSTSLCNSYTLTLGLPQLMWQPNIGSSHPKKPRQLEFKQKERTNEVKGEEKPYLKVGFCSGQQTGAPAGEWKYTLLSSFCTRCAACIRTNAALLNKNLLQEQPRLPETRGLIQDANLGDFVHSPLAPLFCSCRCCGPF